MNFSTYFTTEKGDKMEEMFADYNHWCANNWYKLHDSIKEEIFFEFLRECLAGEIHIEGPNSPELNGLRVAKIARREIEKIYY